MQGVGELCGASHLSDVTLVIGSARSPAHRNILAAHSRVFDRMWAHQDLQEVGGAAIDVDSALCA